MEPGAQIAPQWQSDTCPVTSLLIPSPGMSPWAERVKHFHTTCDFCQTQIKEPILTFSIPTAVHSTLLLFVPSTRVWPESMPARERWWFPATGRETQILSWKRSEKDEDGWNGEGPTTEVKDQTSLQKHDNTFYLAFDTKQQIRLAFFFCAIPSTRTLWNFMRDLMRAGQQGSHSRDSPAKIQRRIYSSAFISTCILWALLMCGLWMKGFCMSGSMRDDCRGITRLGIFVQEGNHFTDRSTNYLRSNMAFLLNMNTFLGAILPRKLTCSKQLILNWYVPQRSAVLNCIGVK